MEQVDLVGHRGEVGGAGDVPAGLVVALHQTARGEVGDGRAHDGDLRGGRGGRLGCGGGDGEDQIHAVAHELARDGLAGGLVVLGVLLVGLIAQAGGVERLDETLVGGIERGVLGELQDADLVGLAVRCRGARADAPRGRAGTPLAAADEAQAAGGRSGSERRAARDEDAVHGMPFLPIHMHGFRWYAWRCFIEAESHPRSQMLMEGFGCAERGVRVRLKRVSGGFDPARFRAPHSARSFFRTTGQPATISSINTTTQHDWSPL